MRLSSVGADVVLDAVDGMKTIPLNGVHSTVPRDVSGHVNLLCPTGDL